MGHFDVFCAVSRLTITAGERCVLLYIARCAGGRHADEHYLPAWAAVSLPIRGVYNGYGRIVADEQDPGDQFRKDTLMRAFASVTPRSVHAQPGFDAFEDRILCGTQMLPDAWANKGSRFKEETGFGDDPYFATQISNGSQVRGVFIHERIWDRAVSFSMQTLEDKTGELLDWCRMVAGETLPDCFESRLAQLAAEGADPASIDDARRLLRSEIRFSLEEDAPEYLRGALRSYEPPNPPCMHAFSDLVLDMIDGALTSGELTTAQLRCVDVFVELISFYHGCSHVHLLIEPTPIDHRLTNDDRVARLELLQESMKIQLEKCRQEGHFIANSISAPDGAETLDNLYLISGRISGDDDDTVEIVEATSMSEAIAAFEKSLKESANIGDDDGPEIFIISSSLLSSAIEQRVRP